jgi:hypothetical protein
LGAKFLDWILWIIWKKQFEFKIEAYYIFSLTVNKYGG